jgi:hypothetical protein
MIPLTILEYLTPSTKSLNSLPHELQSVYIFFIIIYISFHLKLFVNALDSLIMPTATKTLFGQRNRIFVYALIISS